MIERSGDAVYDLHRAQEDEEYMFLDLPSKPRLTVSPGLALKPVATVLVVWPQNHSLGFFGLSLKTGSCDLVSWFVPQNQVGGGLSVCTLKPMSG
jgi:hypothetical protein